MHSFFRKNKKIIVWFVVISFIFGGALMGFGAYNFLRGGGSQTQATSYMAQVNKEPVTFNEFYAKYQQYASILTDAPADMLLMYQYQALNEVIQNKLLMQEVKNEKITATVTDEDVDQYIADFKANYGIDDAKIDELLADAEMDMATWRSNIKEALQEPKLIENLLDKVTGEITITDQDIINEYEEVRASTIFVKTEDKAKIEEALTKLKAGEDFAEVAKAYSQNQAAANGGDLGFFNRDGAAYGEEVVNKAFSLDVGQVSDIFEANDGYYIVEVTDKKVAEGEDFEADKEDIRTRLLTLRKSQIQNDWFEDLLAEAKIEIKIPELAGYKAMTKGNFDQAINKFKEAIENVPGNGVFYSYLAQAYKENGQVDKAIETYQEAIADATIDWEIYYDLGWTYKEIDDKENAVANMKIASEEAGDEKYAHDRIMKAYESMGYKDLALQEQAIIDDIEAKAQAEAEKQAAELEAQDKAAAEARNQEETGSTETDTN